MVMSRPSLDLIPSFMKAPFTSAWQNIMLTEGSAAPAARIDFIRFESLR